jgi:hypothetical protein
VTAAPALLWPPNHELVPIALSAAASGAAPDVVWQDGHLSLRAERSGGGGDRVYTITCAATDAAGNASAASAQVVVPHDQRR